MKLKNLLFVFCLALLAGCQKDPDTESTPTQDTNRTEGVIRMKLDRETAEALNVTRTRSGRVLTGNISFDELCNRYEVTGMERLFADNGCAERTRKAGLDLWYVIRFKGSAEQIAEDFGEIAGVNHVEIPRKITKVGDVGRKSATPWRKLMALPKAVPANYPFNDPLFAEQWPLYNDGSVSEEAVAGADINVIPAWKKTAGRSDVIVAVLDEGVEYTHPDLAANMWSGIGKNFCSGYNEDITWGQGHGTHVAGTIAAVNNNDVGISGMAGGTGSGDGVKIMTCQIFHPTDGRYDASSNATADAIKYAADNGAVICQNSWGYAAGSMSLDQWINQDRAVKEAIDYFIQYAGMSPDGQTQTGPMAGGVVIFAAGNENSGQPGYPAAYEPCISVAAVSCTYEAAWYTNYGPTVDICAPGGGDAADFSRPIHYNEGYNLSTLPTDLQNGMTFVYTNFRGEVETHTIDYVSETLGYGYMQGTSMACPHVSGIAALAVAKYGGPGFTPDKLRTYLERGVHEVDSYNPEYKGRLGAGLIDAYLAVSMDRGIDPDPVTDLRHSDTAGEVELTWTVPEDGDDGRADSFILMWRVGTLENPDPDNLPEGTFTATVPVRDKQAGETISYILTDIAERTRYVVAVIAVDPWGNRSPTSVISFGTPANTPPTLVREGDTAVSIPYNETRTVAFLVSDPDSHGFTYELQDPSGAVTPRKDDERLYLDIRNYKRVPGSYTARITVSDSFGASDAASFDFTLQPNLPPVPNNAFAPVYLGSMQETAEFTSAAGFDDEIPETVTYALEYDTDALYLQASAGGGYRIMPLRYGRSEVTVTATDEEGLAARNSFAVLCRDDSREADLYPNPVESLLTIRMGRSVQGELGVTLYDASGRTVLRRTVGIAPTEPAEIDLSALGSGAYTIRLEHAGGSLTRTIVKL